MAIQFGCKIKGVNHLEKKISQMTKNLSQKIQKSLKDKMENRNHEK